MAYVDADCERIKYYMEWVHGSIIRNMSLQEFKDMWRKKSDQERQVEWDKCTLHADFD